MEIVCNLSCSSVLGKSFSVAGSFFSDHAFRFRIRLFFSRPDILEIDQKMTTADPGLHKALCQALLARISHDVYENSGLVLPVGNLAVIDAA